MLGDEPLNGSQLNPVETKVTRQGDRRQPELRRLVISVHVDVRWLVQVVAHEVDPIRAAPQNSRHSSLNSPARRGSG